MSPMNFAATKPSLTNVLAISHSHYSTLEAWSVFSFPVFSTCENNGIQLGWVHVYSKEERPSPKVLTQTKQVFLQKLSLGGKNKGKTLHLQFHIMQLKQL